MMSMILSWDDVQTPSLFRPVTGRSFVLRASTSYKYMAKTSEFVPSIAGEGTRRSPHLMHWNR